MDERSGNSNWEWLHVLGAAAGALVIGVFPFLLEKGYLKWGIVLAPFGLAVVGFCTWYANKTGKRRQKELDDEKEARTTERTQSAIAQVAATRGKAFESMCDMLHLFLDIDKQHDVRVTLLEVDKSGPVDILRQVARCEPGGPCDIGTTTMSITQGVAGRCARLISTVLANWPPEEYIERMTRDWGFEEPEAKRFKVRGTYLCIPVVGDRNRILAVLSLDAAHPNVFTKDKESMVEKVSPLFAKWISDPGREVK